VADGNRVLLLEPSGEKAENLRVAWSDDGATLPGGAFGAELHLAVSGDWLLVSDTMRHRVLWLDWTRRKFVAQFGVTDKPGDDATHLDTPTFVALQGSRAVVADSGNQRLMKLEVASEH